MNEWNRYAIFLQIRPPKILAKYVKFNFYSYYTERQTDGRADGHAYGMFRWKYITM